MRCKKMISLFCIVACMLTMVIPAFARASDQIDDYYMKVKSSEGQIKINFSVSGPNIMNSIGCESIYIYEDNGGDWIDTKHLDEDDSGMSEGNVRRLTNTINIGCKVGVRYKVVVTIFAEDSAGRDSRQQTFYVTGAA
mgnify:FL=1